MRSRLAALAILIAASSASPSAFFHFELLRSTPAHKAALKTAPARLQLWFSQVPAAGVSRLTLKNDAGFVALAKTVISPKDKSMFADPMKPLGPGRYVIHWQGAGDDGHVVKGDIAFVIERK